MIRRTVTVLLVSILAACSGAGAASSRRPAGDEALGGSNADPGLAVADVAALVRLLEGIERDRVAAYLESLPAPPAAVEPAVPPPPAPAAGAGFHSDAWWRGVAQCEQGGRNDPWFGYFSIMDGSAGGLDWSTQVAMANAILSNAVASTGSESPAWAPACVAAGYGASPGG